MTSLLLDPAAAPFIAAAIGLCVGSFLNVVIHRLPQMLERGWQDECAELRGETAPERPRYNIVVPRSQLPVLRTRHHRAREHSRRVVARAARQVLGLRRGHFRALSAGRTPRRRAGGLRDLAVRSDLGGAGGLRIAVDAAGADLHRLRHAAAARRHHAAAALGGTGGQPVRRLRAAARRRHRRDRRLPRAVDRVLAVQADPGQGRHGLRRLQAAGSTRGLAGLAACSR